jgi:hypothetical protein
MRKFTVALVLVVAVVGAGATLAGASAGPLLGAGVGALLVATVALFGFSTERLAWLSACLLVVTITWNGIRVGGGAFGNIFMVMAFGAMVAHAVLGRRSVPAPPTLLLAGLGFLLAALLSMIFPPAFELGNRSDVQLSSQLIVPVFVTHRSDLFALIQFELSFLIIPLVLIAAGSTPQRVRRLVDLWTVGVVVNAFVGLTDTLGIVHLAPYPLSSGTRSCGLTLHPNYLALGAAMAIPTAMIWFGRSPRWNLAALVSVTTLLGGAYASGSRAGAVAAVVAVGVTAVAVPRLRRGAVLAVPVVGMVAIVVLMFTSTGDHILKQVRLGGGGAADLTIQGSNFQRRQAADIAIAQFKARPLEGVGFSVIADAHSIYLELLAAGGLIALASFLTFCGGLIAALRRALRGTQVAEATALGISILVWLANGIVDNQLADKYLYAVPGLLFAMARVAGRARVPAPVAAGPPPLLAAAERPAQVLIFARSAP